MKSVGQVNLEQSLNFNLWGQLWKSRLKSSTLPLQYAPLYEGSHSLPSTGQHSHPVVLNVFGGHTSEVPAEFLHSLRKRSLVGQPSGILDGTILLEVSQY